jgi:Na+-transporting NADH:ubiquinone oxidoreductase subunit E
MSTTEPYIIILAAIFTNNILLANFLGMCPFLGCSRHVGTSMGIGAAVVFVITCTTALNYLINHFILVPLHLEYLQIIIFITVIAAFVQLTEMLVERLSPALYFSLGIFLPLITVHTAILGSALFMVIRNYSFPQAVAYGFGSGMGWWLAIMLLSGLRRKMAYSKIPKPFQNVASSMITTSIMAMTFMGFSGMLPIQ